MIFLRLTLVGVGATLAADAVNQWLVAGWEIPLPPPRPVAAPSGQSQAHKAPINLAAITGRDIFNSAPGAVPAGPAGPAEPHTAVTVVEPLNLNVRLTGTVVGTSPEGSFAMIMDVARRDEHLYRVGDKVLDEGTVIEITRDLVRLKRGGAEQVLRLFEEEKPGTMAVNVTSEPGLREVGPDQFHFVMDRGELDEALSDMPRLLTQARLLPNFRAGQTDGFRIFNIVPGSIFARIGLKNGDVLHRINDIPIEDPTKFMGVFQELKNESQITVDLVRGSDRKTFEYEIR